ncbi:MAG: hypothetical protein [Microviridae sp.]|nr:MAG: hypothetical protein [Microviridae sp.]
MKNLKSVTTESELPKFRTQYNFKPQITDFETPVGVSETVPDQSYSVRELIQRFTTGTPVNLLKNGTFSDNENPDLDDDFNETHESGFDMIDAWEREKQINESIEYKKALKLQTINSLKNKYKAQQSEVNELKENDTTGRLKTDTQSKISEV